MLPMSQKKNDMPYDFWNYGINPILGFRYMPDDNSLPSFIRSIKYNKKK